MFYERICTEFDDVCATLNVLIVHTKTQSTSNIFDTLCDVFQQQKPFTVFHMYTCSVINSTHGVFICPSCSHSFDLAWWVSVCQAGDCVEHSPLYSSHNSLIANGNSTTFPSSIYATYNKHLHIIRIESGTVAFYLVSYLVAAKVILLSLVPYINFLILFYTVSPLCVRTHHINRSHSHLVRHNIHNRIHNAEVCVCVSVYSVSSSFSCFWMRFSFCLLGIFFEFRPVKSICCVFELDFGGSFYCYVFFG